MRAPETLFRLSLAAMALAVLIALVALVKVTALTSLVLFTVGTPLFLIGLAGWLAVVYIDLRRHGVF